MKSQQSVINVNSLAGPGPVQRQSSMEGTMQNLRGAVKDFIENIHDLYSAPSRNRHSIESVQQEARRISSRLQGVIDSHPEDAGIVNLQDFLSSAAARAALIDVNTQTENGLWEARIDAQQLLSVIDLISGRSRGKAPFGTARVSLANVWLVEDRGAPAIGDGQNYIELSLTCKTEQGLSHPSGGSAGSVLLGYAIAYAFVEKYAGQIRIRRNSMGEAERICLYFPQYKNS